MEARLLNNEFLAYNTFNFNARIQYTFPPPPNYGLMEAAALANLSLYPKLTLSGKLWYKF